MPAVPPHAAAIAPARLADEVPRAKKAAHPTAAPIERPLARPGDIARRAAYEECEGVESEKLSECTDHEPAGGASDDGPKQGTRPRKSRHRDPDADPGSTDQCDERGHAKEHHEDRKRARTGAKRFRRACETVDQSAYGAGDHAARDARGQGDDELAPAFGRFSMRARIAACLVPALRQAR